MLDLSNANSDFTLMALAFGAGVSGSVHCIGMCGGLVLAFAPEFRQKLGYQLGRLAGYVVAVSVLYGLGIRSLPEAWRPWAIGAAVVGFTVVTLGQLGAIGSGIRLSPRITRVLAGLRPKRLGSTSAGLFSILLPCGWFYSIALGSLATGSLTKSILVVSAFWLGSVPALLVGPEVAYRALSPVVRRFPRALGVMILLLGFGWAGYRTITPLAHQHGTAKSEVTPSCHEHSEH